MNSSFLSLPFSPIYKCGCDENNNHIYIKREDLLPFSFGGNKLRICLEFLEEMKLQKKDCMIGYGSPSSNLCRVLSNLCSANNIPCFIIYASDNPKKETLNSQFVKMLATEVIYCSKEDVAHTVENVMEKCIQSGLKPFYINGDKYGKGHEYLFPRAYYKVYNEILSQEKGFQTPFEYIFVATGTGMTQSGLVAGNISLNSPKKIIGISVARDTKKETEIITDYINKYCQFQHSTQELLPDSVIVFDDVLCGGYGCYNQEIDNLCHKMLKSYGIPMDTTYVGKAYYGMLQYILQNKLTNKHILFIDTGAMPLFLDNLTVE